MYSSGFLNDSFRGSRREFYMCGIAGIVFDENRDSVYDEQIAKMVRLVHHRGPDHQGILTGNGFCFGHARLSIIDRSERGNQPMEYRNRFVISYNGEVYNYIELRDELVTLGHRFDTNTDTEVVLAAYSQWGSDCFKRFNGMFAIAIYDKEKSICTLARDRVGEKPLYFYQENGSLYFCSEIKQLIYSDIVKPEVNDFAVKQYLAFQMTLDDQTLFKHIYKLEPGRYLRFDGKEIQIHQYWRIEDAASVKFTSSALASSQLKLAVERAVQLRLRSDVQVGAYLSSGIDSSIVASLASAVSATPLSTFTFASRRTPSIDEAPLAKLTANKLRTIHHELDAQEDFDLLQVWRKCVYHLDEPVVGYSVIPQLMMSEKVSENIKVILGGQGGDELFYGYGWHTRLACHEVIFSGARSVFEKILILLKAPVFFGKLFASILRHRSRRYKFSEQYFSFWARFSCFGLMKDKSIKQHFIDKLGSETLIGVRIFEFKYWLQALMQVEDRASMASSLESRAPLLDPDVINTALSIDPLLFIDGKKNKKIFISTFWSLLISEITNKKSKQGYSTPLDVWLDQNGVLEEVLSMIKNSEIIRLHTDICDYKKLTHRQIWMLGSLAIWYDIYFRKHGCG